MTATPVQRIPATGLLRQTDACSRPTPHRFGHSTPGAAHQTGSGWAARPEGASGGLMRKRLATRDVGLLLQAENIFGGLEYLFS